MKKQKKIEPKVQHKAMHLYEGASLADIIKQVMADGVTDLSSVKYDHNYQGGCHCNEEYCYCEPSYTEMRFCYTVEVK